jgi:hypothetical protein
MLQSLASWFSREGRRRVGAGRPSRRRPWRVCGPIERLERRGLLSATAPGGALVPPVLAPLATQSVEEGNSLTVQVQATDLNSGHSVRYSLDPSAPAGAAIDPTSGLLVWTPPNLQSIYTLSVRATDSDPEIPSAAETLTVMVFNVPPTVAAGVNTTINAGTEFVRPGFFTDPNPDSWTATVDYGDGSGIQPLTLNPDKTFALDHLYKTAGTYTVSVAITDSQGGTGHGYFAVQVVPPSAGGTSTSTTTPTPSATSNLQISPQAGTTGSSSSTGATNPAGLVAPHILIKGKHPHVKIPVQHKASHKHH